ncbi:hypothetical protein Tco_0213230 [Tanacetum coccineum]
MPCFLKMGIRVENKKKLEKAEKERDELKLTLEKFQNSSKSLNNFLESQNVKKVESNHESVDVKNNGDTVERSFSSYTRRFQDGKLARIYIDKIIARNEILALEDIMRACVIDFGGSYHSSIRCAPFEALYGRKCSVDQGKVKAVRDRQKSYAGNRRKPLEFEVGDHVLLKVLPWKGVICFKKKGKLAPRHVEPFEILERIGLVAYRLRLPEELGSVHDTFHVSNLKKCLADANLHVPLDEIKIDKTLRFVEEPVEIMDREIRNLKRSKISLVKVR